jgi:hypothetical protein
MVRRFRIGIFIDKPRCQTDSHHAKWTCGIPMRNEAGEVGKYLVIMTRIESGEEGSHERRPPTWNEIRLACGYAQRPGPPLA